jgi:hypothetical protein
MKQHNLQTNPTFNISSARLAGAEFRSANIVKEVDDPGNEYKGNLG